MHSLFIGIHPNKLANNLYNCFIFTNLIRIENFAMKDLKDRNICPTLEDIGQYIGNSVFLPFCSQVKSQYLCNEKIEFSSCSWEKGWNVKFKKAGKTLCTIYPRENYFTVMIVVGKKEQQFVETILPECSPQLQQIYHQTKEGNGQRWLMIDLEDRDNLYDDIFRLLQIRRNVS